MSKTPTTSKNINIFSLVRLRKECHYTPISADFTPISRYIDPDVDRLAHPNLSCHSSTKIAISSPQPS